MTHDIITEYDDSGEPKKASDPPESRYCRGCDSTWTLWPGRWPTSFWRGDNWFCSMDCAQEYDDASDAADYEAAMDGP